VNTDHLLLTDSLATLKWYRQFSISSTSQNNSLRGSELTKSSANGCVNGSYGLWGLTDIRIGSWKYAQKWIINDKMSKQTGKFAKISCRKLPQFAKNCPFLAKIFAVSLTAVREKRERRWTMHLAFFTQMFVICLNRYIILTITHLFCSICHTAGNRDSSNRRAR